MNFLAHFHLAYEDTDDLAAALGAMLPDLWRMAARPARARRGLAFDAARMTALARGIEHHFETDAWFHGEPGFASFESAVGDALSEVDDGRSRRLRLFAHIAAEMALDGALIRWRGPALRGSVRAAIDAHTGAAADAADLHHAERRRAAGVDPARFADRMTRLFDAIGSFSLPGGYAIPEGLAARLAGVRGSFGMVAEPTDLARWAEAFDRVAPLADATLVAVLERRPRLP